MTRPKAWPKPDAIITITMTQAQAEAGGLVTCECGHPINNHFDWDHMPCAHCPNGRCPKGYTQVIRLPRVIGT